ncbi:MAG: hypothetical protein L0Y66_17330 [Myxococcaceae bacterium]|nr:hypothetical protein [Myxococcaceae bacterium]
MSFDLVYAGCSHDGKTFRDGTMTVQKKVVATTNPVSVKAELTVKGQVNYSGEVDDFLKVDVVQTVSVDALTRTSGKVTVTLDGTIENSTGTYVYANETIELTAGVLPVASVQTGG